VKAHLLLEEPRGYRWPASSLTSKEMAILVNWREKTGIPICQLVKQAILKCNELGIFINH
jgi:hypothetical protein